MPAQVKDLGGRLFSRFKNHSFPQHLNRRGSCMEIFDFRNHLIHEYQAYIRSFILIRDQRIKDYVDQSLTAGVLWPEPLIQLNPSFEPGDKIDGLVQQGILHPECSKIFRVGKSEADNVGKPLRLHRHQSDAIRSAQTGANYVLTTGTGSGKSLAYIIPIVNHVLQRGSGRGVRAIVVYPMNALANSQAGELQKFLKFGYPDGKSPVTFAKYTGQENDEQRNQIIANPPDIILTNYVMLELMLTRPIERSLIEAAKGLRFLVLDELHTYRGRQGADVALLVRRVRDALATDHLQCIGTSATLAGAGTYDQQRQEVAQVSTQLFGSPVKSENVIGETLRRATPARDLNDPMFARDLTERIGDPNRQPPLDYDGFVNDPLSIWIENTFGITEERGTGRLVRTLPHAISSEDPPGAAQALSQVTKVPVEQCIRAIQATLLAGYKCEPNRETGFPAFAFRLHQFISRGDTVYASLESEVRRHVTVYGQQFVPGNRNRVLLPLAFCRECGQEYFVVKAVNASSGTREFVPRDLGDQSDDDGEPGFLHFSSTESWPTDDSEILGRVPEDWIEEYKDGRRVLLSRRKNLPQPVRVDASGQEASDGLDVHFIPAPFRFCLHCGVSYGFRQADDFAKLTSLASEGRSTATTILSLSAIRGLRHDSDLREEARKLLSFTDNRQDASLQAGHFNDFVEIGLLRSALYRATSHAGTAGLKYDQLTQKVFDALNLPLSVYASEPTVKYQALAETERALRNVLGYRLYRDLKRGWRITSPNLEQCGLLEIRYISLGDVCRDEDVWAKGHAALVSADPDTRSKVAKVLLDYMRRELAIKVDYLDPRYQETSQQQSSQRLVSPWAIDENEKMESAAILFPRSQHEKEFGGNVFLSARGGFGQYLRRSTTFSHYRDKLRLEDTQAIINNLLEALRIAGLVEIVETPRDKDDVPGYQLPASALLWVAGDGTKAFHDPIVVPNESAEGARTNPFFVDFYKVVATETQGLQAREHTAQVPYEDRVKREDEFREGKLPILFCSPTMELGVDIKELNIVNMRNIPPTPANYAQRSGRAGRSGQPALVFSYCTTGSPHDQYFFKRPERMVAGAVTPPRLDLANEDLVRAHIHAIWLAETRLSLGKSLKDILDLLGEEPSLALQPHVRDGIDDQSPRRRAKTHAEHVLATFSAELSASDWYYNDWLDHELALIGQRFEEACERWRGLYRAAMAQAKAQDRVIRDASRSADDKRQAERLRREAEEQLRLLTEVENIVQSDFYSYRYMASEGFLPGYSFPRLPLSAFIPARRTKTRDEFLSRPRFLAISEFGPRAIVYHEGSRYIINKVILPVEEDNLLTRQAKLCKKCGFLHPVRDGGGVDLCERCGAPLDPPLRQLFRLQNVSTKRRDKINSDEEERMRQGYEIITGVRFAEQSERPSSDTATVERDGDTLARLTYGHSATLWRINLGWTRRRNKAQYGFVLDVERGYWARNEVVEESNQEDPLSPKTERVIPYVEDRRNCLLFEPSQKISMSAMASLQSALKSAIQIQFQLEDNELAVEPLPDVDNRRVILLYESAEGGAGVLRRLLDDPQAFAQVARDALQLCHFDPETSDDLRRAPRAREDCEAACYDCLMNYYNQRDHKLLDRHAIRELLLLLSQARVVSAPVGLSRAEHLQQLMRLAGSELERTWLHYLDARGHNLPSHAQKLVEACGTRPDFLYDKDHAAIYIDGPHHRYPERQARDETQTECMEDRGYTVIRFGLEDDWDKTIAQFPYVFGSGK